MLIIKDQKQNKGSKLGRRRGSYLHRLAISLLMIQRGHQILFYLQQFIGTMRFRSSDMKLTFHIRFSQLILAVTNAEFQKMNKTKTRGVRENFIEEVG